MFVIIEFTQTASKYNLALLLFWMVSDGWFPRKLPEPKPTVYCVKLGRTVACCCYQDIIFLSVNCNNLAQTSIDKPLTQTPTKTQTLLEP